MPERTQLGRYGENWHQRAYLEKDPAFSASSMVTAHQEHGPALGSNNYLDAQVALELGMETADPAVVVVKHQNPCGYATADSIPRALERAWQGDPEAAFGGVLCFNREIDRDALAIVSERPNPDGKVGWFFEVLVGPSISPHALSYLQGKKAKEGVRVLVTGEYRAPTGRRLAYLPGGTLSQDPDNSLYLGSENQLFGEPVTLHDEVSNADRVVGVVTRRKPTPAEANAMRGHVDFSTRSVKYVKSNAITLTREYAPGRFQLIGAGGGQTKRKKSTLLAIDAAGEFLAAEYDAARGLQNPYIASIVTDLPAELRRMGMDPETMDGGSYVRAWMERAVLNSDAFFPYPDGVLPALEAGVRVIVQPGGSKKDKEVISAVDDFRGVMIFTGRRHFRH